MLPYWFSCDFHYKNKNFSSLVALPFCWKSDQILVKSPWHKYCLCCIIRDTDSLLYYKMLGEFSTLKSWFCVLLFTSSPSSILLNCPSLFSTSEICLTFLYLIIITPKEAIHYLKNNWSVSKKAVWQNLCSRQVPSSYSSTPKWLYNTETPRCPPSLICFYLS